MRKKLSYFCVKMTVAIQIEGRERGTQFFEERYVLHRACSEAEAIAKAEAAAPAYGEPYLNLDKILVRWKIESIDDVYEVVLDNPKNLDGAKCSPFSNPESLLPTGFGNKTTA